MKKLALITLMTLFASASFALSACGSASGPELTVRAYIDAVNAGDKDKFVSLWLPDMQELAPTKWDFYTIFTIKYTIKKIVSQDSQGNPDFQDVTVDVGEESSMGTHDKTLIFSVRQQDGQWYIISPPR